MSASWNEDDPDVLGQPTIKTPPSLTANCRPTSHFGLKSSSNQSFAPGNQIRDFRAPALGPTISDTPKKNRIVPGCSFKKFAANSATAFISKSIRENHTNDLEALQNKAVSTTIKKRQCSNSSDDEKSSFISPQSQQQNFSESQLSNVLKEQTQRRANSLVPPRSQLQQNDSLVNFPSSSILRGNSSRGNYKYHDDAPSLIDNESLINNRAIRAEISHVTKPNSTVNRQILQNSNPHNIKAISYAESSTYSRLTRSQAPRLPPARIQPETVDLLSDDDDGQHHHNQAINNLQDVGFACLGLSSSRVTVLPERFPLLAIHFGLLEVVTSSQSLCTLTLMGSSHNMAWRFNWHIEDKIMVTDLENEDLTGFREFVDEGIVYVALEMRTSTRLENIPVGRNYIICPDATVNEVEKYIILTMTTEIHVKFRDELIKHYPHILKGEKIDRFGRIKLWENHKQREPMPYNVCRERIEKELGEIKFKQERAGRRRAAATGSLLDDPNDSITFVVYPIEPEVPDAVTISRGDMKRLEPGIYFNDNLIDLKIKHLLAQLNEREPEKRRRIHAFSCLFYAKLTEVSKPEEAHTLVAKWTKNVDLFSMDYILFPINSANHWSLMVLARPDLLINWEEDFEKIKAYEAQNSDVDISTAIEETTEASEKKPEMKQEEDDKTHWKPPMNRPAFLHLDSLNMHPTSRIQQVLARYMFFEREKRFRPAQLLRLQENLKKEEMTEEKAINNDQGAAESNENVKDKLPTCEGVTNENDNEGNKLQYSEKVMPKVLKDTMDKSESAENVTFCDSENNDTSDGLKDTPPDETESTPSVSADGSLSKNRLIRSGKKSRKSLSEEENAAQEVALAMKEAMDKFVRTIAWVKCVVPKQQNGYDCGVFVIRFAEMIIQKRPQTTCEDIRNKMRQQFAAEFTQEDIVVERMKLKSFLEGIAPAWKELRDAWIKKMKEEGKEVTDTSTAPVASSMIENNEDESEKSIENEELDKRNDVKMQEDDDNKEEDGDRKSNNGTNVEDEGELNIPSSRNRYKLSQDHAKAAIPSLYAHMIASHSLLSQEDKPSESNVQEFYPQKQNETRDIGHNSSDSQEYEVVHLNIEQRQQQLRPKRTSMADAMKQDHRDHSNNNSSSSSSSNNKRNSFMLTASFESAAHSQRHISDSIRKNTDSSRKITDHGTSNSTSTYTAESLFDNLVAPLKTQLSHEDEGLVSPKRTKHNPSEQQVQQQQQVDASPSIPSASFISTMASGLVRSIVETLTGGNNTPNVPHHTKRKRSDYEAETNDLDTSLKVTILPHVDETTSSNPEKSISKRSKKKHNSHSHHAEEKKESAEVTIITSLKHLDNVDGSEVKVLDLFDDEGNGK